MSSTYRGNLPVLWGDRCGDIESGTAGKKTNLKTTLEIIFSD
jgi:hypothetical protein